MKDFPHRYTVTAAAAPSGDVQLEAERLPQLLSASPAEFDGPGDRWSPETLLVGAVGDCFILTFKAVAAASKLQWTALQCSVNGTLDRIERVTQFTTFEIHADLALPAGADAELGRRVLAKAERNCLVSNSLKGAIQLIPSITVASEDAPRAA